MMLFLAFTLLLLSDAAASKSIIKSLPGFDGNLPFVLETGYIGVGELEAVQLFYYFIESERSPKDDPLVLWLTGGPGCSALSGIIYEIDALHIRKGTIKDWRRCNKTLAYSYNVESTVDYHRNLTKKPYRSLIYSGDHDMTIPYIGTHEWIESLNLTIKYDWEPWFVDGQVAGYAMLYADNVQDYITYDLTFATVKGGGHTAPEYRPEQCFAMMDRWFDYYPL
ncbi:hypothetical protein POPTR_001G291450v4 [Populus trichocarpa]|uniref:Uncharacterized protein n=1 Tax=Populus trichocarpa TaxID=3694 RepID=A0ACC0TLR5_POPTR|nr:hypothetical protein POPTR_001G291450v4 [Populus trichocarpa]